MLDPAIARYYADGAEEHRLFIDGRPRLEYVRTLELLEQMLPAPPARVLGEGRGGYASALGARGYIVELIDPVAHHVERARALATARGLLGVAVGQVRGAAGGDSPVGALRA
jgi:hypothetical protein